MENRFQRILLARVMNSLLMLSLVFCHVVSTQAAELALFQNNAQSEGDVDIERRNVLEDTLDNENFELGVQIGVISIEDFETNSWLSAHFAYHITEYFYAKARYGTSEAGETSFEKLVNAPPLLTEEERELTYYGLNIGYNLMPGEVFLGRDFALNSVFSFELGGGTTDFAGDEKFTVNFSVNQRVYVNDWLTWDIGMSDYIFDTNITGENKTTHNLNFTTGFAFYF